MTSLPIRLALIALLSPLCCGALSGSAHANEPLPTPICARAGVLVQVAETLKRSGQNFSLEAGSVGQVSTGPTALVRCAVRVHRVEYDTNRLGAAPLDRVSVLDYAVEPRSNGIFLRVLGERPL